MRGSPLLLVGLIASHLIIVSSQDTGFELPVQLIGFPVIVLAVRISNFLKKLTYAVNPNTYRSRNRREIEWQGEWADDVEKRLVAEMGHDVCIYPSTCEDYANHPNSIELDWQDIFKNYGKSPTGKRDYYLLSVFLGDIVASPELCRQLAKRRNCEKNSTSSDTPKSVHPTRAPLPDHSTRMAPIHVPSYLTPLIQEISRRESLHGTQVPATTLHGTSSRPQYHLVLPQYRGTTSKSSDHDHGTLVPPTRHSTLRPSPHHVLHQHPYQVLVPPY